MSRSGGRSIVAAAAYRSGEKLEDRRYGTTQDYTRRGGVEHSEIVLPDNAPEWATDRGELWSRVEDREKRDNAQLAREVLVSLPHELDAAQRIELVQEFAQHIAAEYGVAVDMNLHAPSEKGDDRNQHAHLLLTTRGFDESRADGWAKAKDPRFDGIAMQRAGERNAIDELREVFEGMQNRALERADIRNERGELVQVDRRSLADQGLDIEPTIHLGPFDTAKQRNGENSYRAGINDNIKQRNETAADRQPHDREETSREVDAIRQEMDELFEEIASRPGAALQFKRRQRELESLHGEVEELLNGPRDAKREADRMNELLLSGPINLDTRPRFTGIDLDDEPQRRSRFFGLDELNRELAEPVEDEREKDREKGKGKQQLLDTYPRREDVERTPPPEPDWPSFGRGR